MLSSTNLQQLGNDCKYEKSARVKFAENIYGISHYFGKIRGKVILINKIGLVEIYCKNGSLIIQSRGILGIITSNDCRVSVANQVVIKAQINEEGFLPMVIYTKNDTFDKK